MDNLYPLAQTSDEFERLEGQVELVGDRPLLALARCADTCLDLGCGTGALLRTLRRENPTIRYIGIDSSAKAINRAQESVGADPLATFECADIFDLPAAFAGRRFDLVVLRLVLWSVGPDWQSALHVALSMLEPHGRLYSLEPDDALLVTYPENDAFNGNLKRWRERVQAAGCDPFIGRKVAHAVFGNGGEVVSLDLLMNVACAGAATGDYRAVVTNLEGLFCTEGDAVTHPLSRGPVAGTFVCEGLVATVAKTFNKGMET